MANVQIQGPQPAALAFGRLGDVGAPTSKAPEARERKPQVHHAIIFVPLKFGSSATYIVSVLGCMQGSSHLTCRPGVGAVSVRESRLADCFSSLSTFRIYGVMAEWLSRLVQSACKN